MIKVPVKAQPACIPDQQTIVQLTLYKSKTKWLSNKDLKLFTEFTLTTNAGKENLTSKGGALLVSFFLIELG